MFFHAVCITRRLKKEPVVLAIVVWILDHRQGKVRKFHVSCRSELPLPIAGAVVNPAHRLLLGVPDRLSLGAIYDLFRVVWKLRLSLIRRSANKNDDGLIAATRRFCAQLKAKAPVLKGVAVGNRCAWICHGGVPLDILEGCRTTGGLGCRRAEVRFEGRSAFAAPPARSLEAGANALQGARQAPPTRDASNARAAYGTDDCLRREPGQANRTARLSSTPPSHAPGARPVCSGSRPSQRGDLRLRSATTGRSPILLDLLGS